jgi:hypothetical protein
VNLRDRGGCHRLADAEKDTVDGAAEGGLDLRDREVARKGRRPVLQPFQLLDDGGPDDVRTRRQELAEFDVGRPSLLIAPGRASRLEPVWRRAISFAKATGILAIPGMSVVSTSLNTPARARTKPARPNRA